MDKKENIEQKYSLLIHTYLSHKATTEEKKALLNWLQQSDENIKTFSEYKKIFDLTVGLNFNNQFSPNRAIYLDKLRAQINPSPADKKRQNTKKLKIFYQVAAIVLLVFSLGSSFSLWYLKTDFSHKLSDTKYHITVPNGGKSKVVLPDGTKVWLNAGSSFKYEANYGIDSREVYLEGEGYFSVAKDPAKPFTVNSYGLKIKAFGTLFNVKAYPEEKSVITTLVEGIVKIEGKGVNLSLKPKEVVVINKVSKEIDKSKIESRSSANKNVEQNKTIAKEDISFHKNVHVKSDVNIDIYTSWKDNYWVIESESIGNIASILERMFDVRVIIESQELNQYTFTGTFHKETLEQILDILKLTAPLKYEINKGIVVIKGENSRKYIYDNY